ncbi:MAG: hypothetical protein E7329_00070 [Clostridiales bacterium]|nr:hypothetical protein [Clostridiales bacterium]
MKKTAFILCILFVLLCTWASAEISLDFTAPKTNGLWPHQKGVNISKRPEWRDQIYFVRDAINSNLPMLVPPDYMTELDSGWSEDHTVYVANDGYLHFHFWGLEPGCLYRLALFYTLADGSSGECYTVVKPSPEYDNTYTFIDCCFSRYPGIYKDLTLVISGNGEVYTHSFDLQIQNVPEWMRNDGSVGLYDMNLFVPHYVRKDGPINLNLLSKPSSNVVISAPLDGDIYTGYDGIIWFGDCYISLGNKYYDMKRSGSFSFEVAYTLTELSTGQVVSQKRGGAAWGSNDKFSYLSPGINLPSVLNAGEYQLSIEAFEKTWDPDLHQYRNAISLGTDTVNFFIEKEFDPTEVYSQYINRQGN